MIQRVIDHPILTFLATGITCAAIFTESQRWLLPLRIPAVEIDKLASDLMVNFGPQTADIAALEQDRALHNSDPFEQGRWRRVEREIKRRQDPSG